MRPLNLTSTGLSRRPGSNARNTVTPASGILALTLVANGANIQEWKTAALATVASIGATGNLAISGTSTLTGNVNVNGATNSANFGVNVASKHVSVSAGSLYSYGVDVPGSTNNEFLQLRHSGALGEIYVSKSGSGTFRDMVVYTSDVERLRITAAGAASLSSTLAVTGTSTLTGNVGIGGAANASYALRIVATTLTGATQYGMVCTPTFTNTSTTQATSLFAGVVTAAAGSPYAVITGIGLQIDDASKGANSSITTLYGLKIESQTGGGTNIALKTSLGLVQFGDAVTASSTLAVTGVATFTAKPIFSSATASTAAAFDSSKGLVSVTITGSGSSVYSASPTLTGTIGAAAMTLSSTLVVSGGATFNGTSAFNGAVAAYAGIEVDSYLIIDFLSTSQAVFTNGGRSLVSNPTTGSGNSVLATSPTLSGTVAGAAMTLSGLLTVGTTLGVTGVATFTAQPFFSSATASTAAAFDSSKGLISVTNTGSGNNVLSASPTLTGTIGAAAMTLSSTLSVTDTSTLTGNVAIGGALNGGQALRILSTGLTSANQYGIVSAPTGNNSASGSCVAIYASPQTAAVAYAFPITIGIQIDDAGKGSGSTITTQYGLKIEDQTQGGTKYSIKTGTGLVDFGGELRLSSSNTVNASVLATVTNKIKLVVGGTTYYLLASTSNA